MENRLLEHVEGKENRYILQDDAVAMAHEHDGQTNKVGCGVL